MALIEDELKILNVRDLFGKGLRLPDYQRPYRWSTDSVNVMFNDIWAAMNESEFAEYRLGSVVLYKHPENQEIIYDIVDGQQRITTLSMLLKILIEADDDIIVHVSNLQYHYNSLETMKRNYIQLRSRVRELGAERKSFFKFVKNNCTFVSIVTDDQSEAFQFFDSQNHRGKELMPHDLLKAFHLREMGDEDEKEKISVINRWENYQEAKLGDLFSFHLYPLTRWYKGRNGIEYTQADIKHFKGTKKDLAYDYVLYHKAANLFVEDMNRYSREFNRKEVNQFQLTQPILSGTRFFLYVTHYMNLLDSVNMIIEKFTPSEDGIIPENGNGNKYVKRLFQNALMFFADRFGIDAIDRRVYQKIFSFCYVIRISMQAVYQKTINKYALGIHEYNVGHINLFEWINEMAVPDDINGLVIFKPGRILDKHIATGGKFEKLYQKINEYCGWSDTDD